MSLNYFLLINTTILFVYLYCSRVSHAKLKIDHFLLLCLGMFFYWLMPIYAYENNLFLTHHVELYENISVLNKKIYLFYVLIIILSMLLGDWISKGLSSTFSIQNFYYSKKVLDVFLWIFLGLGIYSGFFMRDIFFTTYDTAGEWPHERGWFISVCTSLTTLNVIHSLTQIVYKPLKRAKRNLIYLMVFNKYFVTAFIFNALMLSTGNRGYIMVFFITIVLIYNEYRGGIKLKYLFLISFLTLIFNGYVALLRANNVFSFQGSIGNIFNEFINVGITLFYHLQDMNYNLFEIPYVFFSKFIGIIPSIIFPGKFALMVSHHEVDKSVIKFQATTHNYVELLSNFGLVGTILLFFFFSIVYNWLKSKKHYAPIYIAISAQLPFFFFRSFYDATIKHMFEFSILLPLIILSVSYFNRKYST